MTYKVLNAVTQKFAVKVPLEKKKTTSEYSRIYLAIHIGTPL